MNKLAADVFANFEMSALDSDKQIVEQVHVLVLGNCGVGKSRFVNNICGSNVQTGICYKSLTLTLRQFRSKFNRNLYLCDAPGVSSHDLDSSLIIRNALKSVSWNLIIIQSKLDARFSYKTLPQLQTLARLFKKESSRVVLMVSCLDIEQKQQQRAVLLYKFKQQLQRCSFTQKLMIFSNKSSDFQTISSVLYKVGYQFPKIKFAFDNRKLMNLLGVDKNESQLEQFTNELKKEQEREKILEQINKLVPHKNQEEVQEGLNELNQKDNQDPKDESYNNNGNDNENDDGNENDTRNLKNMIVLTNKYEIDVKKEEKKIDKNDNKRTNKINIKQLAPEDSDQFKDNSRPVSCSKTKQKQNLLQCKTRNYKPYLKKNNSKKTNGSALESVETKSFIQYGRPQMFGGKTFTLQLIMQKCIQETYIPQKYVQETYIPQKYIQETYIPQNKCLKPFLPQFDKLRLQLAGPQVKKTELPLKTVQAIKLMQRACKKQDCFSNEFMVSD